MFCNLVFYVELVQARGHDASRILYDYIRYARCHRYATTAVSRPLQNA